MKINRIELQNAEYLLIPVPYSRKLKQLKSKNTALQIEWEEEKNRHELHLSKILGVCHSNSLVGRELNKIITC